MAGPLQRLYLELAAGRRGRDLPGVEVLTEALHVLVVLLRESRRDRLGVRAAMLSYWTAVAIVPILVVGFTLSTPLGTASAGRDAVLRLLYDTVLTESVEDVGRALDTLLAGANLKALGVIGFAGLMTIGSQLYFNIEQAYNDIFQSRVRRSLLLRFTLFYAGITLGPSLIAAGFVLTASLPAGTGALGRLLPISLSATAMVAAIRLLPDRRVSWRAALTGGGLSAISFEVAKVAFSAYMRLFGTAEGMAGVYGSLAFLPVFLLWLQVVWMVILVGVEVAWMVEHYELLLGSQRRDVIDPHAALRHADADFALQVLQVLIEAFRRGEGPTEFDALVRRAAADPRHLQQALDGLVAAGLLVEAEGERYTLVAPPETLDPSSVRRAWRRVAAPLPHPAAAPDSGGPRVTGPIEPERDE